MERKIPGRPLELHITTADTIDVAAMPLITSMAYGERHVSEMVNMATVGIAHPGFYSGYWPKVNGGLKLVLERDKEKGFSVALTEVGRHQIRVYQQHDIDIDLKPNVHNVVVLEGFYEFGTTTKQVDHKSMVDPARIRVLEPDEVNSKQLIVCEVDLTSGVREVEEWMIDLSRRPNAGIDLLGHEKNPNAHPQYNPRQKANILTSNSVDLSTTNTNLIVGPYRSKLRPYKDGSIIELEALSSVDFDTAEIRLDPPDGEKIEFKGNTGEYYLVKRRYTKLFRYNGRWHI